MAHYGTVVNAHAYLFYLIAFGFKRSQSCHYARIGLASAKRHYNPVSDSNASLHVGRDSISKSTGYRHRQQDFSVNHTPNLPQLLHTAKISQLPVFGFTKILIFPAVILFHSETLQGPGFNDF